MRRGLSIFTWFGLPTALLGLTMGAASAQTTLYGITGAGDSSTPSVLYTVDTTNGAVTLIGYTGFNSISSMDFAPNRTTLYAISNASRALISIDRSTAISTQIGPTGVSNNIPDIAVRADGVIFGVDTSGTLYTFNAATGAATTIGATGLLRVSGGALAFNGSGTLYFASGSFLYTVNQSTGTATSVGTLDYSAFVQGTNRLGGMKFQPGTGVLYGSAVSSSSSASLASAKTTSGTITLTDVGDPGVVLEALAFGAAPVPQATMYGVTGTNSTSSFLYTIDKTTAQNNFVGFTGYAGISSLDFAPDGKSLYAIVNVGVNGAPQTLVNIDPSTGIGIPIGPTGLTDDILDIAVRSDGVIFGIDGTSAVLYRFDSATGTASSVGSLGLSAPVGGGALAFSPRGTLYLAGFTGVRTGSSNLYTVNQTTGAATQVATIDFSAVQGADRLAGMKFDPVNGFLYGTAIVPGIDLPTSHILRGTVGGANLILTDVGDAGVAFEALALGPAPAQTTILPATLPVGTINVPYLHYLVCNLCDGTSWSFAGGTPPPGLTLVKQTNTDLPFFGDGVLSGTPTQAGTFTFTVQATSGTTQDYTMYVTRGPMSITTTVLPGAIVAVPYSTGMAAIGGVPPLAWSMSPPNFNGLAINSSTGVISGTPVFGGTISPIAVTIKDAMNATISKNFTLRTLAISTTSLTAGTVGKVYSATLNAFGASPALVWSAVPASLPPGLTLNSAGVIGGTPTTAGTFSFVVTATDVQGSTSQSVFITIGPAFVITTSTLPDGVVGTAYAASLQTANGTGAVTFQITAGSLPAVLNLGSGGAISGTPTTAGLSNFTVTATDSTGATASKALSINVAPTSVTITITTGSLPNGLLGGAYSSTLAASLPSTWSFVTGSLPAGLNLNASTGAITGTPTALGTSTFTVKAQSGAATAQKQFTITIVNPPAVTVNGLPTTSGPGQQPGASVVLSGTHTADVNGTMTLTFVATGGGDNPEVRFANGTRTANFTVPAGSTNGTIGGAATIGVLTGTVAGTITITLTAKDTDGNTIPPGAPITITVSSTVPFISSVKLVTVSGGFNVVVTGFSSPKNMVSGLFHFTPTSGNTISPADVTVQLASVFSAWYANPNSLQTGSQFSLTVPFTTQGNTTFPVATVTVTLTNSQGSSPPVTSN